MKQKQLSIIVPIYNVEKYVRACMESIYRQGLDEDRFEVIIVNDGTKDRSMEVIADIIQQHSNISVINQENQGLSVARNNGIAAAKGEYILMPDSDDLLIEKSLKPLLEKALETKADLVVADYLRMTDEEIEHIMTRSTQHTEFNYKETSGEQLFLEDLNPSHCYVWRTLFRREFLIRNNLTFVPGIYIQDVPFTHECYLKASKCIKTSWLLNIYRRGRKESATYSFNKNKTKDFCIAIAKTWELTHLDNLSPKVLNKLQEDVYTSFSALLWIITHKIDKSSDRTDIIDFLKRQAPDLLFKNGAKQKLQSWLYRYFPHLFIHLSFYYDTICRK